MNPSLLLGIIIGAAFVFLVLLAVVSISGRKPSNASQSFNERSLAELTERNSIGERQMFAINEMVYGERARRERIATAALAHMPALIDAMDEPPSYYNIAEYAVGVADALIEKLDKPEP